MSGLRGNINKLSQISSAIRKLPVRVAQRTAEQAAPAITARARTSFAAGETAYGDTRREGVDGRTLSLQRTGAFFATLRFVAIGTRVRAALGTAYAKYLMRFGVLPRGGGRMPLAWSNDITKIARAEIASDLGRSL